MIYMVWPFAFFRKRVFLQKETFLQNLNLGWFDLLIYMFFLMAWSYDWHTPENLQMFFLKIWLDLMSYIHFDGLTLWSTCLFLFFLDFLPFLFPFLSYFSSFELSFCSLALFLSFSLFRFLLLWLRSKRTKRKKEMKKIGWRKEGNKERRKGRKWKNRFFWLGGGVGCWPCCGQNLVKKTGQTYYKTSVVLFLFGFLWLLLSKQQQNNNNQQQQPHNKHKQQTPITTNNNNNQQQQQTTKTTTTKQQQQQQQ